MGMGGMGMPGGNTVLVLKNMFDSKEVNLAEDPDFFNDVREDVTEECGKHGPVATVKVVETSTEGEVLVKFQTPQGATAAMMSMNNRWFAGQQIIAVTAPDGVHNI